MKINTLIFDVDGTLWDSTSRIAESHNETMKHLGLKDKHLTTEIVQSFMGLVREDIADIVFPEYPLDERLAYLDQCMEDECKYLKTHAGTLYEGVEEVLGVLSKKYDIYIVSNCQDGYIETLFSSYDLQQYVKDYECSGRTGLKKGDNIKLLIERNDIKNAVYIGDTIKDQEASREAGVPFIFASYGFGNMVEAAYKIDKFSDLLNIL